MIAQLRGTLASVVDEHIVIDVAGVGYEVFVTADVLSELPSIGEEIQLTIATEVRETSITLYGFKGTLERQVFNLLQKVKGIGARLALSVLSSVGADKILASIAKEDIKSLTAVPGIGKKTAERVLVELREQVGQFIDTSSTPLSSQIEQTNESLNPFLASANPAGMSDALLALQKLGFSEQRALDALALEEGGEADSGEILRRALARM